jgi:hypothetical protein
MIVVVAINKDSITMIVVQITTDRITTDHLMIVQDLIVQEDRLEILEVEDQ